MVNWLFYKREELKQKLLELANKWYNGEEIKADEIELLKSFADLDPRCATANNIEEFFNVLDMLLFYINKRGDYAENED